MLKSLLPVTALLLATGVSSFADVSFVQVIVEGRGSESVTLKQKGARLRVDRNAGGEAVSSAIYDQKTGDVIVLLHGEEKSFLKFAKATTDKLRKQYKTLEASEQGKAAKAANPEIRPRANGKKGEVMGFATDEYVVESPDGPVIYAVAKAFPGWKDLLRSLDSLIFAAGPGAYPPKEYMPAFRLLPGFPMRVNSRLPVLGDPVTVSVEKLDKSLLPDSDFTAPADYTQDVGDHSVAPD